MNSKKKTNPIKADGVHSEKLLIQGILRSLEKVKTPDQDLLQKIRVDLAQLEEKFETKPKDRNYLEDRRKALQHFVDDFPTMLGYWDHRQHNQASNKIYAKYFGLTPEKIRGLHIKDLLGPKLYQLNKPFILKVLAGEPQTFNRAITTPSGVVRHTLANYVPRYVNEKVDGFFAIVTDVTEQKALEEKSHQLESHLLEKAQLSALGEMASGIAHEINNPLAIIYANACALGSHLKKGTLTEDRATRQINEIQDTVLRVEKIIDALRAMNRRATLSPPDLVDIFEIVQQTLAICEPKFKRNGITIKVFKPRHPVEARCHGVQVSQIMINLLNNAFDALKGNPKGLVKIVFKTDPHKVWISFKNNGPSIPKKIRTQLFLPFFSTKPEEGTGLGLSISRNLARLNEGDLFLDPSPVTSFTLVLPLKNKK
jgi:two-component system cell cycle sensor histidine kinase/response regulator CckA